MKSVSLYAVVLLVFMLLQSFPRDCGASELPKNLSISGFIKADFIHNFGPRRAFPSLFYTALIPIDGSTGSNQTGDTNFRVNASQLNVVYGAPTKFGELKTHLQIDFFNSDQSVGATDANQVNELPVGLRLAYASLGGLTVGQDWTAFMDFSSYPESADFQGPNSEILGRVPQIKWSKQLDSRWSYAIALDNPSGNFTAPTGTVLSDIDQTVYPDLVGHIRHEDKWGHFQFSYQLREIAYKLDSTLADLPKKSDSTLGWGTAFFLQLNDPFRFSKKDKLAGLFAYGKGLRYINDTGQTSQMTDGGVNPATGNIETERQWAVQGWYQFWWTDTVRSSFIYGLVQTDPLEFQPATHFRRSKTFIVNLFWSPIPEVSVGIDYLYGEKQQKDKKTGDTSQVTATLYIFF